MDVHWTTASGHEQLVHLRSYNERTMYIRKRIGQPMVQSVKMDLDCYVGILGIFLS